MSREALQETLRVLTDALADGTIVDTLWRSDHQTLFDFIEAEIENAQAPQPVVPEGYVPVPVDAITTVERDVEYSPNTSRHTPFLRVSFAYDDYDNRDKLAALLIAGKGGE